jgi:hypothetical protein
MLHFFSDSLILGFVAGFDIRICPTLPVSAGCRGLHLIPARNTIAFGKRVAHARRRLKVLRFSTQAGWVYLGKSEKRPYLKCKFCGETLPNRQKKALLMRKRLTKYNLKAILLSGYKYAIL